MCHATMKRTTADLDEEQASLPNKGALLLWAGFRRLPVRASIQ